MPSTCLFTKSALREGKYAFPNVVLHFCYVKCQASYGLGISIVPEQLKCNFKIRSQEG